MARERYLYKAPKKPVKLTKEEKNEIESIVHDAIEKTEKLKKDIARIHVRAGRVYFYFHKQAKEDVEYVVPLINGKYLEFIYGRITIFDNKFEHCSLDWERHNNKWEEMEKGSLIGCIKKMENHDWFHTF
jgi:hypothetical protein